MGVATAAWSSKDRISMGNPRAIQENRGRRGGLPAGTSAAFGAPAKIERWMPDKDSNLD